MGVLSSRERCSLAESSIFVSFDFFLNIFNFFYDQTKILLLVDRKYTLETKSKGISLNVYNM